ncbi:pyridoxal-dependent decarboxylase [Proteus myxofaciens]|uniref:Histidine decarboxylase n=1 Tax=Proteus myxofaciens ATCC 19692 TaxID=1354337 RepID=A0A198F9P9_9GAMM|nr:pyridoxal-dependent decarboxylase [Proteus myxofaciens]OAT21515.1 histidine decarboxylase [Proteus myxofaciens ATCC 19692]
MNKINNYVGIQVNLSSLESLYNDKKHYQQLSYLTNNLGDCYEPDACPLPNTMREEKAAIELFAQWLGLSSNECWGYIGGGSSIGNLQGMWIGRQLYPDATLIFSKDAHYSIYKFASLLGFKKIIIIDTLETGQIDINDYREKIKKKENIVAVFTAGTTMTSAFDPIEECTNIMDEYSCEYYIHLDAALGGALIPFIDENELKQDPRTFSFHNKKISSMTISTHKVLGTPMPGNLFIARKNVIDNFKNHVTSIPYLSGIKDIMIYGSRDGFRADIVYSRLCSLGNEGLKKIVKDSFDNCDYLMKSFKSMGITSAFRAAAGLSIVIPLISLEEKMLPEYLHEIDNKYHLVKNNVYLHIYVMEHVNRKMCEEIVADFTKALKLTQQQTIS